MIAKQSSIGPFWEKNVFVSEVVGISLQLPNWNFISVEDLIMINDLLSTSDTEAIH